jgi:hypothetical protein
VGKQEKNKKRSSSGIKHGLIWLEASKVLRVAQTQIVPTLFRSDQPDSEVSRQMKSVQMGPETPLHKGPFLAVNFDSGLR